jgi:3-methyl-2-oxobutanoate hydroxymethyltransferase
MVLKKMEKVTVPSIAGRKGGDEKIAMITAYDFPTARIVDSAGADIILVGDSLGMVVLGYESTVSVTMDEMIHHTKAARRGCERALLVGDMPFLAIRSGVDDAIGHAARFMHEAGADAVKVEGGQSRVEMIEAMVKMDIPVMGHVGLTPQSLSKFGGYRVQGGSAACALSLIEDAMAIEQAGVFSIVLECVPRELARLITANVSVPTIGIGAGPDCDGQVLVVHDLLGVFEGPAPKFVRKYANLKKDLQGYVSAYLHEVREGKFPSDKESYHMTKGAHAEIQKRVREMKWKS